MFFLKAPCAGLASLLIAPGLLHSGMPSRSIALTSGVLGLLTLAAVYCMASAWRQCRGALQHMSPLLGMFCFVCLQPLVASSACLLQSCNSAVQFVARCWAALVNTCSWLTHRRLPHDLSAMTALRMHSQLHSIALPAAQHSTPSCTA